MKPVAVEAAFLLVTQGMGIILDGAVNAKFGIRTLLWKKPMWVLVVLDINSILQR